MSAKRGHPKTAVGGQWLHSKLSVAVMAAFCAIFGCRVLPAQVAASESTASSQNKPQATLQQRYEFAFRFETNLEQLAFDRKKAGKSTAAIRSILPQRLNLDGKSFLRFQRAARRFKQEEQFTYLRIQSVRGADHAKHPTTYALSSEAKPTIHALLASVHDSSSGQIARLHHDLSLETWRQLNVAVTNLYNGVNAVNGTTAPGSGNAPGLAKALAVDITHTAYFCPPPPCGAASGTSSQIFSSDGTTVTATLTATITQEDSDNGCYPFANLQYDQDGTVVASDPQVGLSGLTVTTTVSVSVHVGSLYNFQDSYDASCDSTGNNCGIRTLITNDFQTGPPVIQNSPFSGLIGQSGAISVTGTNLGGPFGNTPTVAVTSGSGLSMSTSQPTSTQGNSPNGTQSVNYSLSTSAASGSDTFTLTSVWGSSNAIFNVGCGQPNIAGVSPYTWPAGQTTFVQVTGSNFCPGVTGSVTLQNGGTVNLSGVTLINSNNVSFTAMPDASLQAQPGVLTLSNPATSTSAGQSANARIEVTQNTATGNLYFVDPFLLQGITALSPTVDPNALITELEAGENISAGGVIADGVSTFVAVYEAAAQEDVTFTTNGNLSVLPWDPNFLTASPTGSLMQSYNSVTMPAANLISANGNYYAFALVRAPLAASATTIGSQPVQQITATQTAPLSSGGSQSITLYQKPVLLVHGLWGDLNTFADMKPYIESHVPNLIDGTVIPVCYSRFLPYDAAVDPYTNVGTDPYTGTSLGGCEVTAVDAISQTLQQLQSSLDNQNIVEGQVDYIAHSMGGLVGRVYSNLPNPAFPNLTGVNYANYTNMNQGAFSQVITLDTPELGSGLANFLVANADAGLSLSASLEPTTLWTLGCFKQFTNDLATCLGGFGEPISWPSALGGDPTAGAVASIQTQGTPGSSVNYTPNFPSTITTRFFSATYEQNSPTIPAPSLLRRIIQDLASAVTGNDTPVSTYLGATGYGDDVVVTYESQIAPFTPLTYNGQVFLGLQHSAALPGLSTHPTLVTLLTGDSDANILHSGAIDGSVACLLITSGQQTCREGVSAQVIPASTPVRSPLETGSSITQVNEAALTTAAVQAMPTFDNKRLAVQSETQKLRLAQPTAVTLKLDAGNVSQVHTVQCVYIGDRCGARLPQTVQIAPVLTRADGTSYIQFTPMQLGHIGLIVTAEYANSVFAESQNDFIVGPSAEKPQKLTVAVGGGPGTDVSTLHLDLQRSTRGSKAYLYPRVSYPNLRTPIDVGPSWVTFTLKETPGEPVVSVDPKTGIITPLRAGEALIRTRFAGASTVTCVVVTERALDPVKHTRCQKLLDQPGEELPR